MQSDKIKYSNSMAFPKSLISQFITNFLGFTCIFLNSALVLFFSTRRGNPLEIITIYYILLSLNFIQITAMSNLIVKIKFQQVQQ